MVGKKMDSARALVAGGWRISLVSRYLWVSRAQLHAMARRPKNLQDHRQKRKPDDTDALARIHTVTGMVIVGCGRCCLSISLQYRPRNGHIQGESGSRGM